MISLTSLLDRSVRRSLKYPRERNRLSSMYFSIQDSHSDTFLSFLLSYFHQAMSTILPLSSPLSVMYWRDMWILIIRRLYSRYSITLLLRVYVPFWQRFPSKIRRLTYLSWMRQFSFFSPFTFVHSQHPIKKYSGQWFKIVMPHLCSHL